MNFVSFASGSVDTNKMLISSLNLFLYAASSGSAFMQGAHQVPKKSMMVMVCCIFFRVVEDEE
jgi:hypothetical protein